MNLLLKTILHIKCQEKQTTAKIKTLTFSFWKSEDRKSLAILYPTIANIFQNKGIIMLMPGATEADAALAANVIVRASFDNVIPGNSSTFIPNLNRLPNAHSHTPIR